MSNFDTLPAAALVDADDAVPQDERLADAWWTLRHNLTSMIGLALLVVIILSALLAPLIAPYDPYDLDLTRATLPPSTSHWFGTDQFGHDIFSRVLYGARLDLMIALASVAVSAIIGSVIGGVSGYVGHFVDEATMRLMDMLQAFPRFIFAMGIAFALGPGLLTVIVATAALNIPGYARLMRNLILSLKQTQYAMSAVAIGNSGPRVLFRHLFPNALAPILVTSTLQSGWAILEAAGLSFIGLGVAVPTAEWGVMIAMGLQEFLQGHWWVYTFPGLAIGVTVLAFNLIGDGLQDLLDPRRRA